MKHMDCENVCNSSNNEILAELARKKLKKNT